VKKDDGFGALHLACLNGHYGVTKALLEEGQAEIEITNNRKQTPLHLAVSQVHLKNHFCLTSAESPILRIYLIV